MGWHSGRIILPMSIKCFYFFRTSTCVGSNIFGQQEAFDYLIFESNINWNDLCREMWNCLYLEMACIPPLSSAWVLLHLRTQEMKTNKAKAHILYLQASIAFLWVLRRGDKGQRCQRTGLGAGLCGHTSPTSLLHEKRCTGPWALSVRTLSVPAC